VPKAVQMTRGTSSRYVRRSFINSEYRT
jgi:hypothetical protein